MQKTPNSLGMRVSMKGEAGVLVMTRTFHIGWWVVSKATSLVSTPLPKPNEPSARMILLSNDADTSESASCEPWRAT